jgi:hypothetical protein
VDLSIVANAARQTGTTNPRAGAERIALAPSVLLPLLQTPGEATMAQLARDVRAQLADGARAMALILPPGGSSDAQSAWLDLGTRQIPIPAALREALLAQLGAVAARDPGAAAGAAGPSPAPARTAAHRADESTARAWVTGAQAQAAATQLLSVQHAAAAMTAGAARELLRALAPRENAATRDQTMPAIGFSSPLTDSTALAAAPAAAVGAIALRLRQQLENSGLFYESHLAQWQQGTRNSDDLRAELLHLGAGGQVDADAHAQRVSGQLAVLDRQALALAGPAWPGQPLRMTVEREPRAPEAPADMPPVFSVRLALDLPHLGAVEIALRMAGEAVAATVRSAVPERLAPDLDTLADQFQARGLTPVSLQVVPTQAAS